LVNKHSSLSIFSLQFGHLIFLPPCPIWAFFVSANVYSKNFFHFL